MALEGRKNRIARAGLCGLGAASAMVLAAYGYVELASGRIIERRYALPPSRISVDRTPEFATRGARLAVICGCEGCHGPSLQGARFDGAPMIIYAPNLGLLAASWSDADFDRAIRRGMAPSGRSLWIMPSHAYQFAAGEDVAALISYIRTLPRSGATLPAPSFNFATRLSILHGSLSSEVEQARDSPPPADLGPLVAAGRRIAAVSCVECHGSDLSGFFLNAEWAPPDLAVVAAYKRDEFLRLMRTGTALGNRSLRSMSDTARHRFSHFTDEEVDALYDYLIARAASSRDSRRQ